MEDAVKNSFTLDVAGLLRGETRQVDFGVSVKLDESDFDVTFPRLPVISGSVVNMSGYIELSAKITVEYETACSRCLRPLVKEDAFEIKAPVAETLENMDNDEYLIPENGQIDLGELVRETLILNLPVSHLCREDCKGLCIKCGKDLNDGDCGCVRKEKDPRWSVLEHFFDED
ncbi:MAG: DUF177 domain-containing protein [Clostridia bacterium]|nr:DUF177 domain-containing protein [Clostridia bacterium]